MSLNSEERNAIVTIRLIKAKETLQEAKEIVTLKLWRAAANRLYYACYYAVIALLIKNGYSPRTHSGAISLLSLHFVSKGIISEKLGKFYGNLFEIREKGDYSDWITIEAEDVLPRLQPAQKFIEEIEKLINQKTNDMT